MSVSFASDSNNDFIIENGEFVLVEKGPQVVQNIRERLLSYQDDFFLDRTQGVPYYQTIFRKPFNAADTESIIKTTISQTEGVARLTQFQSNFNGPTRDLTVTFTAETNFGNIEGVTINV